MDMDIVEFEDPGDKEDKEENDGLTRRISRARRSSYNNELSPIGRLSTITKNKGGTFKRRNGMIVNRSGTILSKKGLGGINDSNRTTDQSLG